MYPPQLGLTLRPSSAPMSAQFAKRWGRRLLFVWLGMWLSAALLPCGEAAAATGHGHALAECGCPVDEAPDSGGGGMNGACLVLAAPVRAPAERLAVQTRAESTPQALDRYASSHVPAPRAALSPRSALEYRAPPPVAVYLRSSRLLI